MKASEEGNHLQWMSDKSGQDNRNCYINYNVYMVIEVKRLLCHFFIWCFYKECFITAGTVA